MGIFPGRRWFLIRWRANSRPISRPGEWRAHQWGVNPLSAIACGLREPEPSLNSLRPTLHDRRTG